MRDTIQHILPKVDSGVITLPDTIAVNTNKPVISSDTVSQTVDTTKSKPVRQTTEISNQPKIKVDTIPKKPKEQPDTTFHSGILLGNPISMIPDTLGYEQIEVLPTTFKGTIYDAFGNYTSKYKIDEKLIIKSGSQTIGEGRERYKTADSEWNDLLALGLFVCFTLVLLSTRRFLISMFPLIFNNQKAHKKFEEDSQSYSQSRRLYFIPSIFIAATYFYYVQEYMRVNIADLSPILLHPFILITLTLFAIAIIKYIIFLFIGFTTLSQKFIAELLFNRQLILIAASIFLFPVAVLLPLYNDSNFGNALLIIGLIIIGICFIAILLRSLMLFRLSRVSLFLWILYLCTLEIAPYLALIVFFQ